MEAKNFLKFIISLFLTISFLGSGFCFPILTKAQQENNNLRILYQGNLNNSDGTPVQDGKYNIRFRIYDSEEEGNILWEEQYTFYDAVFIKDGNFEIILGRKNPININLNQPSFWLGTAIGTKNDSGDIVWNEEMKPRKKIISLSDLLKEEGLQSLEENGITDQEWQTIYQLLEKKLNEKANLVFLFNMDQLKEETASSSISSASSKLFNTFQDLINFISGKISEILDQISKIRDKIENLSIKLGDISTLLGDIKYKIDTLYEVLVVDKGLTPLTNAEQETTYKKQKVERLILKEGENSIRILNQSVTEDALIFVSFLDDPGSEWWISEKIPGNSFNISLRQPAQKDLRFDYWILTEQEIREEMQQSLTNQTSTQPVEPQQSPEQQQSTTSEEQIQQSTEQLQQPPAEETTTEQQSSTEQQSPSTENSPTESPVSGQ